MNRLSIKPVSTQHLVTIRETRRGKDICETTPRYEVLLNGNPTGEQLYFNTRGFIGHLPLIDGSNFYPGEVSISKYRAVISKINRGQM